MTVSGTVQTDRDTDGAAPEIAVVIPHFDDVERLTRCLGALTAQDLAGAEIIVADNATPGGLDAVEAAFGGVRFVTEPERGAAAARNAGVAASTAGWIAFLDSDCVPAPDWAARLREIVAGPRDSVTGGRVDVFDETPPPRTGAEVFETVFAFDQKTYVEKKGFSVTANLVTARATFAAVGPFRPGVSEDLDWCRRATAAGYGLRYDPALVVRHPTRSGWPALRRKWLRLTAEGFGLLRDGYPPRVVWALKALAMPLSVAAHIPRILRHPGLSATDRARGIATLTRLRLHRMGWMLRQASGRDPR